MKNSLSSGIVGAVVASLLGLVPAGAFGQCCGDCNGDGAVTIDEMVSAVVRSLEGCRNDAICVAGSCPNDLADCRVELDDCRAQPAASGLPASGQTSVFGAGSDGNVRAGAPLSFTDNGDGTVTDNNTGLMWEKKDRSGGVHDVDIIHSWSTTADTFNMSGTLVTVFLATLNRDPCFAGHCDWRVPNVKELQSIVDYEKTNATAPYTGAVSAAFSANCTPGCSATGVGGPACSCTVPAGYWTSTTYQGYPLRAYVVLFESGLVTVGTKTSFIPPQHVRAVRGGL